MRRLSLLAGFVAAATGSGCFTAPAPLESPAPGGDGGDKPGVDAGKLGTGSDAGPSMKQGVTDASVTSGMDGASGSHTGGMNDGATLYQNDSGPQHPPQQVVSACTSDGGLAGVGVWENITPTGLSLSGNGVTSVAVDPINSGTLYAGTDSQGIFVSKDCGSTWALASTGMDSAVFTSGLAWFLMVDPIAPNVLYGASLYGTDGSLLKSTNSGKDWASVWDTPLGGVYGMQWGSIDPGDHLHIVASIHQDCMSPNTPVCLAETHDGGMTWQLVNGPPSLSTWEEAAAAYVIDENTFLYLAPYTGIYYTNDDGQTWTMGGPDADETVYKAVDGRYYVGSQQHGLLRSDAGASWTPIPNSGFAVNSIIGDGLTMYSGLRGSSTPFVWTSPETEGDTWTAVTTPTSMTAGPVLFGYDSGHSVLYSANASGGLWRVVTK
jgi:hypothetical protein